MTRAQRKSIRKSLGLSSFERTPKIQIIPGIMMAPRIAGQRYYFTTPGGRPVHHPNAYRRAWGKPVYHASTRRTEVGELWLSPVIA